MKLKAECPMGTGIPLFYSSMHHPSEDRLEDSGNNEDHDDYHGYSDPNESRNYRGCRPYSEFFRMINGFLREHHAGDGISKERIRIMRQASSGSIDFLDVSWYDREKGITANSIDFT